MGFFFKRTKPAADLTSVGLRCRATVEHTDLGFRGSAHTNMSTKAWSPSSPATSRRCG